MERKLGQRWPLAKKFYDKQFKETEQEESDENKKKDEKNLFKETGINCARIIRYYVFQIIHKYYYDDDPIDDTKKLEHIFHKYFKDEFNEIIKKPENIIKYYFFLDELKVLIAQSSRRIDCDLTERYVNIKLSWYMREHVLMEEWKIFRAQPYRMQLLEAIATIAIEIMHPEKDISYSCIKTSLDNITQGVLNCLREKHPNHSIFLTSAETFFYWKNNNIDNYWDEAEGMQIMNTLEEYIFDKLSFRLCEPENRNVENMCIDTVLKNKYGEEIILFIIYHSVARRLGLSCNIRFNNYYGNVSLFWKPNHATNSLENARCYIITFEKYPNCCCNQLFEMSDTTNSSEFITLRSTKMLEFLRNSFSRLTNVLNVLDRSISNDIFHNSNQHEDHALYHINSQLIKKCFENAKQSNTRSQNMKFAVGMIVEHDNCFGVIVGWYRRVNNNKLSFYGFNKNVRKYAILQVISRKFKWFKLQQTKYVILTEDNEIRKVKEDCLILTAKWINNSEIGRYFCKFEGTHYVPNKMLARIYPHDAAITAQTRKLFEINTI